MVAKAPERGIMVKRRRQGRLRPADRAADDDLRRPAAAALLALQRPLPRRPAQPPGDALGLRRPTRPRSTPAPGSTPNSVCTTSSSAFSARQPGSTAAPARTGRLPRSRRAAAAARSTPTPPPTRPFYLHLTPHRRRTGDHLLLGHRCRPGVLGKIAGVPFCSEAQIEAAKRQTGAESAIAPACPEASLIGHTYTGYGVGLDPRLRARARSTSPGPTTARRSRWWRSTRPRSAPSTSAPW